MLLQPVHLLHGFHALRHHAHLQRQSHGEDGLRQFLCIRIVEHAVDEGLIDLQTLQR